jgi:hypothetical protein
MIKKIYERKCANKSCGANFKPTSNTQRVCSIGCSIEYAKTNSKKKQSEISRLQTRKLKDSVTGLPELKKLLETQINAICRLLDKDVPCISCNGTTTPQAGHYHSVGSHPALRFNLFNVAVQDYNCNCAKGGNQHAYDLGLIKMYGKEYWEYVKFELPQQYPVLKLTKPELLEAIGKAKDLVKALKNANITYSVEQRKRLRHEYNSYIGIYTLPNPI